MRIYQNEQIGDIYRVLRGNLEDAIDTFNTNIKKAEIDFLKKCAIKGSCTSNNKDFINYLDNFYLILDKTDAIILSYYSLLTKTSCSSTFTISWASKVSNSIAFYDKLLKVLNSELLEEYNSYYDTIFSNFDALKSAFIAFADL